MMTAGIGQFAVFICLTILIATITWWKCRQLGHSADNGKDYFLAGGSLSWPFIAGSLVMTNISAEQIVGMNGAQTLLVAWWEIGAAIGLIILAHVLIPLYYKYNCTTTTELLEHRLRDRSIRLFVSALFMLGYLFILLPMVLYTGSVFMKAVFGIQLPIIVIALIFALPGLAYAALGGLRAIAVSDTYYGIGLFVMGITVFVFGMMAIDWDFSGIPLDRLTLVGGDKSDIPWHTLLTGMVFIHLFYWGTNMVIAQRALAAKNVREAQKGIYATAIIKLVIPLIVVVPGLIAYKLYGPVGDSAYGTLVANVMPPWLSGVFATVIFGAVLSSYNACLNSAGALYTCDFHERYINPKADPKVIGKRVAVIFTVGSLAMVPFYENARSIVDTLQRLNGLYSMPVLSAFIAAIVFSHINALAVKIGMVFGVALYAVFTFVWSPLHYIHLMAITLFSSIAVMLLINKLFLSEQVNESVALAD